MKRSSMNNPVNTLTEHLALVIGAMVLLWPMASIAAGEQEDVRPNVILILSDVQGFADVGIHGHPVLRTPNLDRIANEGIRFTQFQASAECSPTRASLMTGRNHLKAGVTCTFLGKYYLPEGLPTMAELLRDAGYQTAIIGKWHLGEHLPSRAQDRGFEHTFVAQCGALAPLQGVSMRFPCEMPQTR